MKIASSNVPVVLSGFIEREIAPKATSGTQRFLTYSAAYLVSKKASEMLQRENYVKNMREIGVMDDEGLIDLDFLREMATYSMQKAGGKVEVMGVVLDQSDVDSAYQLGRTVAVDA